MNSGEEYRLKKEAKTVISFRKNRKYSLSNPNQNWEMSLRRPNNFVGTRKEIINFGTQKYPFWSIATEKNPENKEYISKPKREFNYNTYGTLSSMTNSLQNLFNHFLK